jgi:hypothetical protein
MFLQSLPLPSIKTVVMSFLNDMIYRKKLLDSEKEIELRQHRTGNAGRHQHYTDMIFSMVKKLRGRKCLRKAGAHKNIIAKLGATLGPYYMQMTLLRLQSVLGGKLF